MHHFLTAIPFNAMAKKKKKKQDKEPDIHENLEGFEININEFGQIETSYKIDRVNEFLNKNVEDKKLVDRDDYKGPSTEEE